ncbi:MAG: RNA polymerase sigma factor [Leptospira bouyouniensis]
MDNLDVLPHLFRLEYSKIVSVLCKHFGFHQIETAEDIASDTFLAASQTWGINGIPENPIGWLYTVAKNKAKNLLQRDSLYQKKVLPLYQIDHDCNGYDFEFDLSDENIKDSQLRVLFALSHPSIPLESQICLSLRILCGFGIDEIAKAFLSNEETIRKRLFRAKQKLRESNLTIELPSPSDLKHRLTSVIRTIYLIFNEGYCSHSQDKILRKDFCLEAIRLCIFLLESKDTNTPEVNALISLFCFHISRFDARLNDEGEMVLFEEQNRSLWNQEFIKKGEYFFMQSNKDLNISKYHLEAAIAYWHTFPEDTTEKWDTIYTLYSGLIEFETSEILILNRAYALFRFKGRESALEELKQLNFQSNRYYFSLLAEIYSEFDPKKAKEYFQKAYSLSDKLSDRLMIQKRMNSIR